MNPHFYSLEVCKMLPGSINSPAQTHVIADWQQAHGLTADGVIGPMTADAMHVEAEASDVKLHFTLAEYLPKGYTPDPRCMPNIRRTMRMCEVRRLIIHGGVPCVIIAGLRDPSKPRKKGQAKHSQHYPFEPDGVTPLCKAADLQPAVQGTGTPAMHWGELTLEAMQDGRLEPGGFHVYHVDGKDDDGNPAAPFIHTDWRGAITPY